jgi:hypothetical protein
VAQLVYPRSREEHASFDITGDVPGIHLLLGAANCKVQAPLLRPAPGRPQSDSRHVMLTFGRVLHAEITAWLEDHVAETGDEIAYPERPVG